MATKVINQKPLCIADNKTNCLEKNLIKVGITAIENKQIIKLKLR